METKQSKKPTNAQLQKKLEQAVLHIDKTKDTQSVYFYDKMLRLTVTDDFAIVETGFHRHVFSSVNPNSGGYSRPWLFTKRFIETALSNECSDEKGHSYSKLFEILQGQTDRAEYNMCWFYDKWLFNIFAPLYSIDETAESSFIVYESYLHNIARQSVILGEKEKPITYKDFVGKVYELVGSYITDIGDTILFNKQTDEELVKSEAEALEQHYTENLIKELTDASQD